MSYSHPAAPPLLADLVPGGTDMREATHTRAATRGGWSDRDAVITGLGLLTPVGIGAQATWDGLCDGASRAATDPVLAGLPVDFSCAVPDFRAADWLGAARARRLDPYGHFGLVAARLAVADAGLDPDAWCAPRVGVVIGTSGNSLHSYEDQFHRLRRGARRLSAFNITRSLPNMVAAEIALDLGARGVNLVTTTACASGATALGTALDLLRAGRCDIVLAGGSDSGRSRMTAACFASIGALSRRCFDPAAASRPFDTGRDGFVLGEGAAVLVLERPEHAARRGARARARLAGYGASSDAHHAVVPHPEGLGAEAAVRAALADAGCGPGDIDHVNAHGSSTPHNDMAEARLIRRLFPQGPPVTANKSVIGHGLGAAGAVEAAVAVLSLGHGVVPPTPNLDGQDLDLELDVVVKEPRRTPMRTVLSTSFGFGGHNAALVLRTA